MDKKATTSQGAFMPTACADCGTWFFKVSKYRYHRRTTHRQNPFERTKLSGDCELLASAPGTSARAKCSLCGLVLLAKNADEHMLRHVQRFDCQDCGRKFRSARDLRSHRELHQAVQVVCPECGIGFRSKAVYRSHRARKHSEGGVGLSQQRSASRRFCPVCQKQLHKNSLQKHLLRAHGDDDEEAQKTSARPTCPICAKEFASDESLRRHSQLHDAQRN
uniref:C2H2-type domain-containing protein n=1 Tax=Plectus sambesii TaxID=2011161 RepID=A0A914XFP4_9BILA